jgi:UDP-2-acetamido-3-amino-2,3-dideoxy-glucuronate N-acetyltransferase
MSQPPSQSLIEPGAVIGDACEIHPFAYICGSAKLGNHVQIGAGAYIGHGAIIEDGVVIGPHVLIAAQTPAAAGVVTRISQNARIEAGSHIHAGITIGRDAHVVAGSHVFRNVPPNFQVSGNPAQVLGTGFEKGGAHKTTVDLTPKEGAVRGVKLYTLPQVHDMRGDLVVGEFGRTLPFTPQRYFLVFNVPNREVRGEHAHRECHQLLIATRGTVRVMVDDGNHREDYVLDSPNKGLHMPPMTWGVQYGHSPDAVLLVFASHYYESSDYIRDYEEFCKLARDK